jgi:hypothetical protein
MNSKSLSLDLVIRAVLKLDPHSGERANATAFIKSCFGGRVCDYDFDAAQTSLAKLTDEEQHALITYVIERA